MTEKWASDNLYCPKCGRSLERYPNNTKAYDFYCDHSDEHITVLPQVQPQNRENLQLKSRKVRFANIVTGSAYEPTKNAIESGRLSFMLLRYELKNPEVKDLTLIHKLSVTLSCIEPRKPLSEDAKRKGWIGYKLFLNRIPDLGRVGVVENSNIVEKTTVMRQWDRLTKVLQGDITQRGWIADIMKCIDGLPRQFTLPEAYRFETGLAKLHPKNAHIKPKIRQQLQILRDRGYIRFVGRGKYERII